MIQTPMNLKPSDQGTGDRWRRVRPDDAPCVICLTGANFGGSRGENSGVPNQTCVFQALLVRQFQMVLETGRQKIPCFLVARFQVV